MTAISSKLRGLSWSTRELRRAFSSVNYRTVLILPGQGVQSIGMAGALCSKYDAAKKLFDEASSIVGYDLLKVCKEGPPHELNTTVRIMKQYHSFSGQWLMMLRL